MLVDEYQDLNLSQYGFGRDTRREASTITVVGDDDRPSTRAGCGRGDHPDFERDFPDGTTAEARAELPLDSVILDAAHEVVS